MDVAAKYCSGRLVLCHEGGYNASTVPYHGLGVIETLADTPSGMEDPFEPLLAELGGQDLQPHQAAVIESLLGHLNTVSQHWG